MDHTRWLTTSAALVALTTTWGCASTEVAAVQQSMIRAEARIEEAEQSGAYEHGGVELERAREKLAEAREAAEDGDEERAERLAVEAELDAELALAMASNSEMKQAVDEVNATIATLRQELRRTQ